MKENNNHLAKLLILILVIALMKWAVEKTLYYFAVPSNIVISVTIVAWGFLALASFLFIRNWLVAYRETNQSKPDSDHSYDMFFLGRYGDNEYHLEVITKDFKEVNWHLHINIPKGKTLEGYQTGTERTEEII